MAKARLTGQQIGPFILQEVHGAGGVAEVYKAVHIDDEGPVAVKVLRPELVGDKERERSINLEADLLAELKHVSIPALRRRGTIDGRLATVMQFFTGETLKQLLEGKQRFDRIGAVLALVNVVAYLHEAGVIHNDLKLENVILRPQGKLGLVDFGNIRRLGGKRGLFGRLWGRGRPVFGTASYLAPELITGGQPSLATDVYALGVCMHFLFSGTGHFNDTRQTKRLNRMVKEDAPSIAGKVRGLPAAIAKVVDQCLVRDPALRPADAIELKALIKHAIGTPLPERARALAQRLDAVHQPSG